jgi:succinoglycan biosynthesis transport protein ExoP
MAAIGALRRRKVLILTTVIVLTSLTALATPYVPPSYTATSTVIIEPREIRLINVKSMIEEKPAWLPEDEPAIATQLKVLESRSLAHQVIEKLGLDRDPEFKPAPRSAENAITLLARDWLLEAWLTATGLAGQRSGSIKPLEPAVIDDAGRLNRATDGFSSAIIEAPINRFRDQLGAIDRFLDRLEVKQDGRSHVLSVSFTSKDPRKAAQIANIIVETYIEDQLQAKIRAADWASRWVAERLGNLREELLQVESAVEQYRAVNDLLDGRDGNLETQQLVSLNTALIDARAERTVKAATVQEVHRLRAEGAGYEAFIDFAASPVLSSLRQQDAALGREQARLSTEYGERHPLVVKIKADKEDLARRMDEEINKIVRNLENEVAVARSRERALDESLEQAKHKSGLARQATVQLRELEREATAKRSAYEALLKRLNEIQEQQELLEPDAEVISIAAVPDEPSFPKLKIMVAIGFTGSLMLGTLMAALREHLDRGLRTGRQIEQVLGLPSLGLVPRIKRLESLQRPHRYLLDKPLSAYAEAIKAVQMAVQLADFDVPPQVVLVTSTLPGEGKTTLALSLSASVARSGGKTLVMDLDLRHPSVARQLGRPVVAGLVEFITGERSLDEIIFADASEPNLHVIPVRTRTANPSDILYSQKMTSALAELRHRYEYIVLDAPPTLGHTDAKVAALLADAVVFVVQWQETSETLAVNGVEALAKIHAPLAGVVLTQVKLGRHAKYGYGDVAQYYERHKKYYMN